MKKLIYALLLSASLVSNVSAAKSRAVNLDATIDEVSAQIDNTEAKGLLAWMKAHKTATAFIGLATLAGTVVAADVIVQAVKFDSEKAEEGQTRWNTAWNNSLTKYYVVDNIAALGSKAKDKATNVKNNVKEKSQKAASFVSAHKKAVIATAFALVAAILVAADLSRGEKASLIRNLFAKIFAQDNTNVEVAA